MKTRLLIVAALTAFAAPAMADTLDMSKANCKNYMDGASGARMSVLFGWLASTNQAQSGVLDYDKVNKDGEELHRTCYANPTMSLKEAGEKAFKN